MNGTMSILRGDDFGATIGGMEKQRFGDLIREARERQGWRSIDLGVKIGRDGSFVSRLETGRFKETPPPDVLAALSEYLGLDEAELLRSLGYFAGLPSQRQEARSDAETVARLCKAVEAVPDWSAAEGMAGSLLQILIGIRADQVRKQSGSAAPTSRPPIARSASGR